MSLNNPFDISLNNPFWETPTLEPPRLTAEEDDAVTRAAVARVFGPRRLKKLEALVKKLSPPSKKGASDLRKMIHDIKLKNPGLVGKPLLIARKFDRYLEARKIDLHKVCPPAWLKRKSPLPRRLEDALQDPPFKKLVQPLISKA
jgi:hypothetical protein